MNSEDSSDASTVSLWEDLELESLLANNRKSLATLATSDMLTTARTSNKKILGKHKNMLAKPGFNILMNRYNALPHAPTAISSDSINRLSDPLRGRFVDYDKYGNPTALSKQANMRQLPQQQLPPIDADRSNKGSDNMRKEMGSFLTGMDDEVDDDYESVASASMTTVAASVPDSLHSNSNSNNSNSTIVQAKIKDILSKSKRNYVSNIFKKSGSSKLKVMNSVLSPVKSTSKAKLHPFDVRNRRLAEKLKLNMKTKFRIIKHDDEQDSKHWDGRMYPGLVGVVQPLPRKNALPSKPQALVKIMKMKEILRQNRVAAANQNRSQAGANNRVAGLVEAANSKGHFPPSVPVERNPSNANGTRLPPLSLPPSLSVPLSVSVPNNTDVTNQSRQVKADSENDNRFGHEEEFPQKALMARNNSNMHITPIKRQPSLGSTQRSSADQFNENAVLPAIISRQSTLRRNNSGASPIDFSSTRKGSFDFTQFDKEHNLHISNNRSFREVKRQRSNDIHVNKHDHSSRHAPWLLGTNTDIDARAKVAKQFANKHLEQLKMQPLAEAINALITPRSDDADLLVSARTRSSSFVARVALADAVLLEAQAVNNFALKSMAMSAKALPIDASSAVNASATATSSATDAATATATATAAEPVTGRRSTEATPRARASSSTKMLFDSIKQKLGVDYEMISRVEKLAKRVEDHLSMEDFDHSACDPPALPPR